MNRHERRKTERQARRRRDQQWADGILRFTAAAKGAFETYIIHQRDRTIVLMAAACGDPTAAAIAGAIATWTAAAIAPDGDFLCLNCDRTFGAGNLPAAFAVLMPFAERETTMTTGICACCAASGEDLQVMSLRCHRSIWPDAYAASGGHA